MSVCPSSLIRFEQVEQQPQNPDTDEYTETESVDPQSQQALCCAICEYPVTSESYAIPVAGSHLHYRENPQQQRYGFRCFSAAPGCRIIGEPTSEHSWFSGFYWQFAHCRQCGSQLGWYFVGEYEFYGLIDEQVKSCDHGD